MWRKALCGFLFSCAAWAAVWAQSTAQLSGTVRDQSGAVLPGVEVKATQTATRLERSVLTNATGSYIRVLYLAEPACGALQVRGEPHRFPDVCANRNRAAG